MLNICVLYGGKSGEHEVSLKSAASVVKNFDVSRYRITVIGIVAASAWQEEVVTTIEPGQMVTLAGHELIFQGIKVQCLGAFGTRLLR